MGKPDQLKRLAEDLRCVKCHVRPRVANRQVCRECRRQAEERDLQARSQLLPNRGASNHQQAGISAASTRKARAASSPTGKALVPAPPVQPVPVKPKRPDGMTEPYTVKAWASAGARWLSKFLGAKPTEQRERAERAMAAEHTVKHAGFARVTYGQVPLIAFYPRSNEDLSHAHWGLERQGVQVDSVDLFGDIRDVKRLCEFCGARVRVPCENVSKANSCRNRSRGNR